MVALVFEGKAPCVSCAWLLIFQEINSFLYFPGSADFYSVGSVNDGDDDGDERGNDYGILDVTSRGRCVRSDRPSGGHQGFPVTELSHGRADSECGT